jgi:prepilin-type processing-associated H-X9-DG protein
MMIADSSNIPTPPRRRVPWRVIAVTVTCAVLVFGAMFVQALNRAWREMLRLDCQHNLSELGVPCREFAEKHNGQFPSKWTELNFVGEDFNWAKVLCCPQTHHETGDWKSVDLWADYRLLPGRSTHDPPNTILAIEPLGNHASTGANVLFVDGSTEWWPLARLLPPKQQAPANNSK